MLDKKGLTVGSVITLGLGRLEIDWGKNTFFRNHSKLFLPSDKRLAPYYGYALETRERLVEEKAAYVRQLKSAKRRLELLGFTLGNAREMYEEGKKRTPDFYEDPEIDFDMFVRALRAVDVEKVEVHEEYEGYDLGEYVARVVFQDPEFNKTELALNSLTKWDGTLSASFFQEAFSGCFG